MSTTVITTRREARLAQSENPLATRLWLTVSDLMYAQRTLGRRAATHFEPLRLSHELVAKRIRLGDHIIMVLAPFVIWAWLNPNVTRWLAMGGLHYPPQYSLAVDITEISVACLVMHFASQHIIRLVRRDWFTHWLYMFTGIGVLVPVLYRFYTDTQVFAQLLIMATSPFN